MITLNQECILHRTERNGYGQIEKTGQTVFACRVKEKYQLVKSRAGKEVTSQLEIMTFDELDIQPDYLIEFNGRDYPIISVRVVRNTLGEVVKRTVFL